MRQIRAALHFKKLTEGGVRRMKCLEYSSKNPVTPKVRLVEFVPRCLVVTLVHELPCIEINGIGPIIAAPVVCSTTSLF
jgi:hypothetical protein